MTFRSDANTDSNNFSSIYFDANDECSRSWGW
jgi:hypothetical protein